MFPRPVNVVGKETIAVPVAYRLFAVGDAFVLLLLSPASPKNGIEGVPDVALPLEMPNASCCNLSARDEPVAVVASVPPNSWSDTAAGCDGVAPAPVLAGCVDAGVGATAAGCVWNGLRIDDACENGCAASGDGVDCVGMPSAWRKMSVRPDVGVFEGVVGVASRICDRSNFTPSHALVTP